jgi:hypothetical protein
VITIDTPETRKPAKVKGIVTLQPRLGSEVMWEHDLYTIWSLGHAPGCFWLVRNRDDGETVTAHVHKSHLRIPPQKRRNVDE